MPLNLEYIVKYLDLKVVLNQTELLKRQITQLDYDSRKVKEGSIFFCIKGEKTDGHNYIQQVVSAGAIALVCDKKEESKVQSETNLTDIPVIYVPQVRKVMGQIADLFYGRPSCQKSLIGVTGTNGKTTVTHLIAQILSAYQKHKIGLVGTLGSKIFEDGKQIEFWGEGSGRTTPESVELQSLLAKMVEIGCSHTTMEVSSHSLEQGRVEGCHFKTAVFTNLTQDHLDYHLTMENYFQAKAKLFDMLTEAAEADHSPDHYAAVINLDSEWASRIKAKISNKVKLVTYSILDSSATIYAHHVRMSTSGIEAKIKSTWGEGELNLPLNGLFNLYNALAALGVALTENIPLADCLQILQNIKPAPGRFQIIEKNNNNLPTCIVDYAHTPDGLENVLRTAREIVPDKGKLISVFGCGGDRDPTKRPIMGRISAELADQTIVTSDNPRSEEPNQIVADILSGISSLQNIEVEIDRALAIERAITEANSQDIVVIAGKGHEDYQIFANETIHFDDCEEVRKVYNKLSENKL